MSGCSPAYIGEGGKGRKQIWWVGKKIVHADDYNQATRIVPSVLQFVRAAAHERADSADRGPGDVAAGILYYTATTTTYYYYGI